MNRPFISRFFAETSELLLMKLFCIPFKTSVNACIGSPLPGGITVPDPVLPVLLEVEDAGGVVVSFGVVDGDGAVENVPFDCGSVVGGVFEEDGVVRTYGVRSTP